MTAQSILRMLQEEIHSVVFALVILHGVVHRHGEVGGIQAVIGQFLLGNFVVYVVAEVQKRMVFPSYQGIIVYQSEMMLKRKWGTPLGVPRCEFLCHGQLHLVAPHGDVLLSPAVQGQALFKKDHLIAHGLLVHQLAQVHVLILGLALLVAPPWPTPASAPAGCAYAGPCSARCRSAAPGSPRPVPAAASARHWW